MKNFLILIFLLSIVPAVAKPQGRQLEYIESLRSKNDLFAAAVFEDFVSIKASEEVWNLILNHDSLPAVQKVMWQEVSSSLHETPATAFYLSSCLGISDLSTVRKQIDESKKQRKLTPALVRTLNSWKGRMSFAIEMNFKPEMDKMDAAGRNLDQALYSILNFDPPAKKAFFKIKLDPAAKTAKVTKTPDGVHWTIVVPVYTEIKASQIKVPRRK